MRAPSAHPRRVFIVTVALIIISSILVAAQSHNRSVDGLNQLVFKIVAPVHEVIAGQAMGLKAIWSEYGNLRGVHAENERLRAENERLRLLNVRIQRLKVEKKRLANLLDIGEKRKDLRLSVAYVRHRSNSPYFRTLGLKVEMTGAKVESGMPVLSADGLVGQVSRVSDERGEVLLLTDPRTAVDVVLEKSRVRGVAVGNGDPREHTMTLKYLDRTVPLIDGERVMTTGDDGRFPSDILVGTVQVTQDGKSGPFRDAVVRPAARLDDVRLVYVVLGTTGLSQDGARFLKEQK